MLQTKGCFGYQSLRDAAGSCTPGELPPWSLLRWRGWRLVVVPHVVAHLDPTQLGAPKILLAKTARKRDGIIIYKPLNFRYTPQKKTSQKISCLNKRLAKLSYVFQEVSIVFFDSFLTFFWGKSWSWSWRWNLKTLDPEWWIFEEASRVFKNSQIFKLWFSFFFFRVIFSSVWFHELLSIWLKRPVGEFGTKKLGKGPGLIEAKNLFFSHHKVWKFVFFL